MPYTSAIQTRSNTRRKHVHSSNTTAFANFVAKCKNCKRAGSINVHKESPRVVKVGENGRAKDVLGVFDCRGIELTGFEPGNTLTVVTVNGKTYENIDVRYQMSNAATFGPNTTRSAKPTSRSTSSNSK